MVWYGMVFVKTQSATKTQESIANFVSLQPRSAAKSSPINFLFITSSFDLLMEFRHTTVLLHLFQIRWLPRTHIPIVAIKAILSTKSCSDFSELVEYWKLLRIRKVARNIKKKLLEVTRRCQKVAEQLVKSSIECSALRVIK